MKRTMKRIAGILRATAFSPNSNDRTIMEAVAGRLEEAGAKVTLYGEETFTGTHATEDVLFSMARCSDTLVELKKREANGALVINSAHGVTNCLRPTVTRLMQENAIPIPCSATLDAKHPVPDGIVFPCWLKRGDASAQVKDDVCFVRNRVELDRALRNLEARGIRTAVVSEHVEGDVVKFYGVADTTFFYHYYPTLEQGHSKFGLEKINGPAHRYPFDAQALKRDADKVARITDTPVYGGDCIVTPEGRYRIIDFNDWPSFARCIDEAAEAVTQYILKKIKDHGDR